MELKFDVIKGQKFEVGRTINPFLCDCKECDFLNCPKKNYAVKTRQHIYKVKEFISAYAIDLKSCRVLTSELIGEFLECFRFPKGTYWDLADYGAKIRLVSFNRRGSEVVRGTINTQTGEIWDYDLSSRQYALSERISKGISEVYEFIMKSNKKGKEVSAK